MPALIDEEGQQVYAWKEKDATIGRTPESTVQIPLPGVSRRHCRVILRGVHYTIQDLGSKNGTVLNEKLIADKELLLQPGDIVHFGKRRLRFELEAPTNLKPKAATAAKTRATEELVKPTIEYAKEPPARDPAPLAEEPDDEPIGFIDDSAVIDSPPPSAPPAAPPKEAPISKEKRTGEVICSKCVSANLPGSTTCWNCKAPLPEEPATAVIPESQKSFGGECPQCGTPYQAGARICLNCGMSVAERRAVVSSHSRILREELFWWTTGIFAVLALVAGLGYYLFFAQQRAADVSDDELYTAKLDRAEATSKEAGEEQELRRYDQALDLYREAEELAKEAAAGLPEEGDPAIRSRAGRLLARFSEERKAYAEWLEANRARLEAEEEFRRESEKQVQLGRAFFHGGWIPPEDEGLVPSGQTVLFPEEDALEKALARQDVGDAEMDKLLGALLRRVEVFQEKYYLEKRFWNPHRGPLPEPEPILTEAHGTRYPAKVSAEQFPEVYLARVTFSPSGPLPRGTLQWDEGRGRAQATVVFHDSVAAARAATEAKDIVKLSQQARLVSSTATATMTLDDSQEDSSFLSGLIRRETPPLLLLVFRVAEINDQAASREIPHELDDGSKFSQVWGHHKYTLTLNVIQATWFRRGDQSACLPLFPEKEPKDGLYRVAIRALGMEE